MWSLHPEESMGAASIHIPTPNRNSVLWRTIPSLKLAEASGDVVIAVGGSWGTLSEIGLARSVGRPVILLGTWEVTPPEGGELDGVRRAQTPAEAVELALA